MRTPSARKKVIMQKKNDTKRTDDTKDSPPEGIIARLRYRRRHPHLYRHPRTEYRHLNRDDMTTPLQFGGKSVV